MQASIDEGGISIYENGLAEEGRGKRERQEKREGSACGLNVNRKEVRAQVRIHHCPITLIIHYIVSCISLFLSSILYAYA